MENPKRGEMTITLGETTYKGRLTLDVTQRIERALGRGIVKIAQSLSEADITTEQIVAVITPVIRAGGNNVTEKDIKSLVWEAGVAKSLAVCTQIIGQILGVEEDEGNVEQAAELL